MAIRHVGTKRALGFLLVLALAPPPSFTHAEQQDFETTLELAKTATQLQQLLAEYPSETKRIIPKLEQLLISGLQTTKLKTQPGRLQGINVQKNRYSGDQKVRVEPVSSYPSVVFPPNSRMWLGRSMAPTFQHGALTEAESVGSVTLKQDPTFEVILEMWGDRIPPFVLDSTGGVRLTGVTEGDVSLGHGSLHRFTGEVALFGYKFFGDGAEADRLTFVLLQNLGYVYLRGNGRVITKEGREIKFGDKSVLW